MADLDQVVADVGAALRLAKIDYMVIGGVANAIWGSPRSTVDVDITIAATPEDLDHVQQALGSQIAKLPPDPREFATETGVLPFIHRSGIRVELMLGAHPYALIALSRAIEVDVLGVPVKVCTPEDLILHKILSDRERDRGDVVDIIARLKTTLDRSYLDPRVHELAVLLERPDLEAHYRALIE